MAYLAITTLALLTPIYAQIQGPHITVNFPDPGLIHHDGTTYAFATNNRKSGSEHINVQIASSPNNQTWTLKDLDALPHIAPWQNGNAVWAPDVKQLPDGTFLLLYTDSLKHAPQTHCVGAALSRHITGPYHPLREPIICPHGGAIDPAGFYDESSGKRYILYKIDGNSLGHGGSCGNDVLPIHSTPLMLQEVDKHDGTSFIGAPMELLDRDALDGPLIEAPAMHRSDKGVYFLFYSANCFTTPLYHTAYATALNITGPYTKASRPLFMTGDYGGLVGPGGMDVIGGELIAFHGIMDNHNDPGRGLTDVRGFERGMYSGRVKLKGRIANVRGDDVQDEDRGFAREL